MRSKTWAAASAVGLLATATGCTTQLELQYTSYTPPSDGKAIMDAAIGGAQIIPLPRTNIFLVPTASLTGSPDDSGNLDEKKAQSAKRNQQGGAKGARQTARSMQIPEANLRRAAWSNLLPAAASEKPAKDRAGGHAQKPARAAEGNKQAPATPSQSQSTSTPSALANPMATALIDGVSWTAIPVPAEDSAAYMAVTGTNNLFHTDSLLIAHHDNSDIISSVNSKATNETANIITTAAGVVAAILPLAAAAGAPPKPDDSTEASKAAAAAKLRPTWIRVSDESRATPTEIEKDQYWYYTLTWDPPAGTVTFDQFVDNVKGKDVSIFPVPACITATLSLYHATGKADPDGKEAPTATFFVTVETPNYIRPYQLSSDGALTMGTVCGASASGSGTSESDTTQGIVKAFSAAATSINSAFNKKQGNNGKKDNTKPAAISAPASDGK